jgi:hypothetical protein
MTLTRHPGYGLTYRLAQSCTRVVQSRRQPSPPYQAEENGDGPSALRFDAPDGSLECRLLGDNGGLGERRIDLAQSVNERSPGAIVSRAMGLCIVGIKPRDKMG